MTNKTLLDSVTMLCEAFGRTASRATFKAYEIGLEGIPAPAVEVAAARALRTCRFMPSPSELRELAGDLKGEDRAAIAWNCVLDCVCLGPYKHVNFADDRIINATIRNLGGWPTFLSRFNGAESEKWVRKEFMDTYESLYRSGVNGEMCAALPGLSGGYFADGRAYLPKVEQIATPNMPALPAPQSRTDAIIEKPLLELKRP